MSRTSLNYFKRNKRFLLGLCLIISITSLLFYSKTNVTEILLNNIKYLSIDTKTARKLAITILDRCTIPDGDLSIPSDTAHSKRYIISKWQRCAIGSSVIILGVNASNELCVVLGRQNGVLRNPQGYMEVPLPTDDLTGLRRKKASRYNGKTSELVAEDASLEDNAIREVFEETGIKVNKKELSLLGLDFEANGVGPVTLAINYMLKINSTPTLSTNDSEFAKEDLQRPMWVKLSNIKYDSVKRGFSIKNVDEIIDKKTIELIRLGLKELKNKKIFLGSLNIYF